MLFEFFQRAASGLQQTTPLEAVAVASGIASVWLSRKASILTYPVGLVNTVIYVYLSVKAQLFGEASVNLYYTVASVWGWVLWSRAGAGAAGETPVRFSSSRERVMQVVVFAVLYAVLYAVLHGLQTSFAPGAIPSADAFASATAYVGMWLMAKRRVESWVWWILTDLASIPLYSLKGYAFTSVQYTVFLVLAVSGLIAWWRKAQCAQPAAA